MKRFLIITFVLALTFGVVEISGAMTISFTDDVNYWPGWNNNTIDDFKDTIGIPNLLGGRIEINADGELEGIEIDYEASSLRLWDLVYAGDLFISTDPDINWDYLVRLDGNNAAGYYPLYPVDIALDSSSYLLSDPSDFPGYNIRQNHPYGYEPSGDTPPDVYFGGLVEPAPAGTMYTTYFDFGDYAIPIDGALIIGWTQTCANDVLYVSVPEPTTVLLLGSGLMGLALFARRKARRSQRKL